jgi:hypothetical protein
LGIINESKASFGLMTQLYKNSKLLKRHHEAGVGEAIKQYVSGIASSKKLQSRYIKTHKAALRSAKTLYDFA